jgi:DNA-binding NarL/FixJ family response regulator
MVAVEPAPTKVIIYDDDPGILSRLTSAISKLSDVHIVGQTSDLSGLETLFGAQKPDVAVMRLSPEAKTFQLVRAVKTRDPIVALIVLSNSPSIIYHKEWKKAGVDFYFDTAEAVEFLPDFFSWKRRTFHNEAYRKTRDPRSERP